MGILMDELKIKQVNDILLMPINCTTHCGFKDKRNVEIKKQENTIETTQTYWQEYKDRNTGESFRYNFFPDCDMSDFACGFYEIIYKDFLDSKKIVDDNGCLVNKEYAGDTMTSVSKLPGLKDRYRCLANFWILPMELGRKSEDKFSKTSHYYDIEDYMDRFLLLLKYKLEEYKKRYPNYFSKINKFEKISDIHLLFNSYLDKRFNVLQYSHAINKNTEKYLWSCIEKRAETIANSRFGPDLWKYFANNNLLET